ncbi:MAG: MBL fold metallo-hydrolase [Elusimicrobia bacterium]|nr:MBL fold metallo-hydrolase [Elusimicrobiota bacterium]
MRVKAFMGTVIAAFALLVLFVLFHPNYRPVWKGVFERKALEDPILEVTYFYVGQGDATLVRDVREGGKVMLIDAGPIPEVEQFVTAGFLKGTHHAEVTIAPFLREEGIERIDYVVVSHKDGDHIGGIPYIVENFDVGLVYDNPTRITGGLIDEMYSAIRDKKETDLVVGYAGMEIDFGEDILCQFVGPLREYRGTGSDENNNSLVLRITVGDVSFLMTGDMEIPAELDMLSYGEKIHTTIVSAPHHGSASSSTRPLLNLLKPEIAVISVGRYNPYGLPDFDVIRRYEALGTEIYRTDLDGHITLVTDGINYRITTERR